MNCDNVKKEIATTDFVFMALFLGELGLDHSLQFVYIHLFPMRTFMV